MVLKWLESKIIVICWKLCAKLRVCGFLSDFVTFSHKVVQTLFVLHESGTKQYLVYIIVLNFVRIENNSHML